MSLLPREHGAYGQITLPLVTTFFTAGASTAGLLIAAATAAGFLAHEPAAVLVGLRGPRARRELHAPALRWFIACGVIGVTAGVTGWLLMPAHARGSVVIPLVPALALAASTLQRSEKSWHAQVATALAFSGVAVPVAMAAGASLMAGLSIAIPFAVLFVTTTLAVRVVILRVRGGGDPRAVAATRLAVIILCVVAAAALTAGVATSVLPSSVLPASAPGLLTALFVSLRPPSPAHLYKLGWTLVAVSVVTGVVIVVMQR
ncbi:MAG TPA: YwiC-like family protein [Vicinamibacterales bacterium]|nr:YwiC-like family protein [Vicinamibacterales bacterium]